MKISTEFMIREIAGEYIIVPTGKQALSFNSIASTNAVGCLMWKRLQSGCSEEELVQAILAEYEVEEATAQKDVESFLESLRKNGILEE